MFLFPNVGSQTVFWGNDVDANGENPVFYEGELEGFSFIRWVHFFCLRLATCGKWTPLLGDQFELLLQCGVNRMLAR